MAQLCFDLTFLPDDTPVPLGVSLMGWTVTPLGPGAPPFVNQSGPGKGVQFADSGMSVTLPVPRAIITMSVGTFNSPVKIAAKDANGGTVATRVVPANNQFNLVSLRSRRRFVAIELTGGGEEGSLASACITI